MVKVSVIVPVYNASAYLIKCIESILRQTLRELEIICIDDGSTDDSLSLLRGIRGRDSRVRVLVQQNAGAAVARNYGLREAEGEYVAFVDADDFLMDFDALQIMYQAACENGMAIVGAFRSMEREGKISAVGLHRHSLEDYPLGRKMAYRDYQYEYHFQNYIYRRNMLTDNQIFFPNYCRFQDPPFFVKAMIAAEEFYVVPVEYYCYHCEHEKYHFSVKQVEDIVRGLTELLELSAKAELKKLHVSTVDRLDSSFFWDILEYTKVDAELLELLRYADSLVRWEWVSEQWGTLQIGLRALTFSRQWTKDGYKIYTDMIKRKHRYGYPVPFYRMRQGSRIILYAAGHVGTAYYEQLREQPDYCLSLWTDANYQKMPQVMGRTLASPSQINETDYDYILIAVEERAVAGSIKNMLTQMKVDISKIIWGYFDTEIPEDFSIFGAGRAATSVTEAIYGLWKKKPRFFVVSDVLQSVEVLCDCPVIGLEQYDKEKDGILLIAVPETQPVEKECRRRRIMYQCVSGDVENRLLGALYEKERRFQVFHGENVNEQVKGNVSCRIYMTKSAHDRELEHEYQLPTYISPIYAGAACAVMPGRQGMLEAKVQNVAELRDDAGDNISLQNPYYCELTALYWVWKNAKEDYVGLCHYRRVFDLSDGQLEALLEKRPDVVLIYPSIQYPNAERHERRYLNNQVRQAVRDALKLQSFELYQDYENIMNDKYIYNFNMILAKKEVLDTYCEWLFRTIRQIEDICEEREIMVERRQQGYWAEDLMSLYFLTNKQGLSLYHVGHRLLM